MNRRSCRGHSAELFKPDKLNIAALGNQVPQLHVHHIVRYTHDPAWPAPVWGKLPPKPYYSAELYKLKTMLTDKLQKVLRPALGIFLRMG